MSTCTGPIRVTPRRGALANRWQCPAVGDDLDGGNCGASTTQSQVDLVVNIIIDSTRASEVFVSTKNGGYRQARQAGGE